MLEGTSSHYGDSISLSPIALVIKKEANRTHGILDKGMYTKPPPNSLL